MSRATITRHTEYGSAVFSPCEQYRYALERRMAPQRAFLTLGRGGFGIDFPRGLCLFVMLNPSTADEAKIDPTVARCLRYARVWGFATMQVTNIFALRSTDPRALYSHPDPIGPENDARLVALARDADLVVCAWGTHGALHGRGEAVRRMLESVARLHVLRLTKDGHPSHPLYLPANLDPVEWGA